jgi:hypothetical protein
MTEATLTEITPANIADTLRSFQRYIDGSQLTDRVAISESIDDVLQAINDNDAGAAALSSLHLGWELHLAGVTNLSGGINSKCGEIGGRKKAGHKGPLNQLIKNIIDDGADSFCAVLDALGDDDNMMVDEFDGKSLTFYCPTKDGDIKKTVSTAAIRKAYNRIKS